MHIHSLIQIHEREKSLIRSLQQATSRLLCVFKFIHIHSYAHMCAADPKNWCNIQLMNHLFRFQYHFSQSSTHKPKVQDIWYGCYRCRFFSCRWCCHLALSDIIRVCVYFDRWYLAMTINAYVCSRSRSRSRSQSKWFSMKVDGCWNAV